jgi:hypothetical protein
MCSGARGRSVKALSSFNAQVLSTLETSGLIPVERGRTLDWMKMAFRNHMTSKTQGAPVIPGGASFKASLVKKLETSHFNQQARHGGPCL